MGPDWSRASGLFLLQPDEWSTGRQENKASFYLKIFKNLKKAKLMVYRKARKQSVNLFENVDKILKVFYFL